MKFDLALIAPPLVTILSSYLKTARRILLAVLVVVSIAIPQA